MEFQSEQLSQHIYRIKDPLNVFVYLVMGNKGACLLDSGYGAGDLKGYIQETFDVDPFVVLTHGHIDHIGGANAFEKVYLNPKEKEVYHRHMQTDFRKLFFEQNQAVLPPYDMVTLSPYKPYEELLPYHDGQIFSLGDVQIAMIEVPGHTPGMCVALIPEDRTIVFGDACGVSVLLFDEFSSSVQEYRSSLEKLKLVEPRYDTILRNHGSGGSPKTLLDEVIACCDDILAGNDAHQEVYTMGECLYSARPLDEHMQRKDGKEGNILYRNDKVEGNKREPHL